MRALRLAAAGAGALVLSVVPLSAQAQQQLSEQDQAFLVQAHQNNLAEIAAGEAAVNQAATELVRAQGQMLITDHTTLDESVRHVADAHGVELPAEPTAEQQAQLAEVTAQQGAAFDQAWTQLQIAGHQAALALGEQEIQNGSNAEVIALAENAAPVIQKHLTMLESGEAPAPDGVNAGTGGQAAWQNGAGPLPWIVAGCGLVVIAVSVAALRRRA
ncbi:DUF4142 domain-containing protein [Jiangella aurantiaca]|uniref:DUF4142 domain-containing protein n=1 Tax=Jiangella aurantiaca TaxID=2530373 RepID=UPI0013A5E088|nr:DUF4142 domain-containing protein [Jiangella aurantiaca]